MIFAEKDSLRLEKTYKRFAAYSVLRSIPRVDQFAIITAKTEQDTSAFNAVVKFMELSGLVSGASYVCTRTELHDRCHSIRM